MDGRPPDGPRARPVWPPGGRGRWQLVRYRRVPGRRGWWRLGGDPRRASPGHVHAALPDPRDVEDRGRRPHRGWDLRVFPPAGRRCGRSQALRAVDADPGAGGPAPPDLPGRGLRLHEGRRRPAARTPRQGQAMTGPRVGRRPAGPAPNLGVRWRCPILGGLIISSLADSEMLWRVTDWPVTIARRLARHLIPIRPTSQCRGKSLYKTQPACIQVRETV